MTCENTTREIEMTEPTWNKEQIEQAMKEASFGNGSSKDVIAILERPAYVPKVGEVYYWANIDEETYYVYDPDCKQVFRLTDTVRPLTRKECGPVGRALDVAIDELHNVRNRLSHDNGTRAELLTKTSVTEALSEIKRLEAGE